MYNENDKVRGESMYFDADAVFEITGEEITLIGALSTQQGGSMESQKMIRDILAAVVKRAATPQVPVEEEVPASCIQCPKAYAACPHAGLRVSDSERYKKCHPKAKPAKASPIIVGS